MPRTSKVAKNPLPENTLVVDNGAYTIKAGFAPPTVSEVSVDACHIIPNTLAKLPNSKQVFVGSQLSQCKDFAEMVFRRPVQKGQLVNWEAEREIWSHSFFDPGALIPCNPAESNLILTEASNGLGNLSGNADQIVFEEFEFAGYRRVAAPVLSAYSDVPRIMGDAVRETGGEDEMNVDAVGAMAAECVLVIDSGYSHTTVTPIYKGRPIQQAVRRLEVGGKFLTNYLKEMISLRQLDLTHEFHIVNEMKEDVCYVTHDLRQDLERTWKQGPKYDGKRAVTAPSNESKDYGADGDGMEVDEQGTSEQDITEPGPDRSIVLDYILPDYTKTFRGRPTAHNPSSSKIQAKLAQLGGSADTVVTLGNERFAAPEVIFSPSDIGMPQAGLPEVVMQAVRATPPGLWTPLLGNILAVGGNARIRGFVERLEAEVRALAPVECVVRASRPDDEVRNGWLGGARLASMASERGRLGDVLVTRKDYLEHGEQWLKRQFAIDKPLPS